MRLRKRPGPAPTETQPMVKGVTPSLYEAFTGQKYVPPKPLRWYQRVNWAAHFRFYTIVALAAWAVWLDSHDFFVLVTVAAAGAAFVLVAFLLVSGHTSTVKPAPGDTTDRDDGL